MSKLKTFRVYSRPTSIRIHVVYAENPHDAEDLVANYSGDCFLFGETNESPEVFYVEEVTGD